MSEEPTRTGDTGHVFTSDDIPRALVDMIPDFVFVVDDDMRVVLINPAGERFLGRTLEEVRGMRVGDLFGPLGVRFEARLAKAAEEGHLVEFEDWVSFGDRKLWQRTSLVPLDQLAPGFVLGVARDITAAKLLEIELREHASRVELLATRDSLTDIANRRAFVEALENGLARARRGTLSCVLFMDLDDFKRVNDERGHVFGDEVLAQVARILDSEAREVDQVARIGGDEFAAILVDCSEDAAHVIADRMKERVEALGAEIGIPMSVSIGVTCIEPDSSADSVMRAADRRMYDRKGSGRQEL
jgi:diguanylate cyclase (GGDEF)-like protein/PAS domain S-box-containing protein